MGGRHLAAAAVTDGEGLREALMRPAGGLFTPELRSQGQPAPVPRAPLGFWANHYKIHSTPIPAKTTTLKAKLIRVFSQ